MADNSGMQQSSVQGTKKGIHALEQAHSGIMKCRQDVEATRNNLASHYRGGDGKAFQDLVNKWEEQADIILRNLQSMVDRLNETLAHHQQQQGSSHDSISQAGSRTAGVFEELRG
jgi:uncharacterized protein YukE